MQGFQTSLYSILNMRTNRRLLIDMRACRFRTTVIFVEMTGTRVDLGSIVGYLFKNVGTGFHKMQVLSPVITFAPVLFSIRRRTDTSFRSFA